MRGYFVTGTDTGVGKTVVSAALALHYGFGYWKPVQTGEESDTAEVARLAACDVMDVGFRYPRPVSPHLSDHTTTVEALVALAPQDGQWIVEGAGGVLVPLNDRERMVDLMAALGLPVIVVARTTLGTINHTLLSLEVVRKRGLHVDRVVMVGEANAENRDAIGRFGQVAVSEIPWFSPLTPEAVRSWRP